jgi:hypothetical protein
VSTWMPVCWAILQHQSRSKQSIMTRQMDIDAWG